MKREFFIGMSHDGKMIRIGEKQRTTFAKMLRKLVEMTPYYQERCPSFRTMITAMELIKDDIHIEGLKK